MFAKGIFVFTFLACAFLQVISADDPPADTLTSNGLTRLTTASMNGMGNVLNSGASAAADGVDLTSTSMANGLQTLGGTAAMANNVQKMKFDAFRKARRAAGLFGESLTNLGSGAIAGALQRGAEAIDASRRATAFLIGEADKVGGAGKRVAKSTVSNTSGSVVNALNGIDKVVTSTGAVREEVADGASAIHDVGTEVVKEGVKTWKDLSVAQLNNFRAEMQRARESAIAEAARRQGTQPPVQTTGSGSQTQTGSGTQTPTTGTGTQPQTTGSGSQTPTPTPAGSGLFGGWW